MKRTTFIAFLIWACIAPALAWAAIENLPPSFAFLSGVLLAVSTGVFAMWRAYRDSLP